MSHRTMTTASLTLTETLKTWTRESLFNAVYDAKYAELLNADMSEVEIESALRGLWVGKDQLSKGQLISATLGQIKKLGVCRDGDFFIDFDGVHRVRLGLA